MPCANFRGPTAHKFDLWKTCLAKRRGSLSDSCHIWLLGKVTSYTSVHPTNSNCASMPSKNKKDVFDHYNTCFFVYIYIYIYSYMYIYIHININITYHIMIYNMYLVHL